MVKKKLPFSEKQIKSNIFERTFSKNLDEEDLKWHYDEEDRVVISLEETDWQIQFDNKLPQKFEGEFLIPKGVYHRIIKGTKDCKVQVTKNC